MVRGRERERESERASERERERERERELARSQDDLRIVSFYVYHLELVFATALRNGNRE
jgi:hypothetical protein